MGQEGFAHLEEGAEHVLCLKYRAGKMKANGWTKAAGKRLRGAHSSLPLSHRIIF